MRTDAVPHRTTHPQSPPTQTTSPQTSNHQHKNPLTNPIKTPVPPPSYRQAIIRRCLGSDKKKLFSSQSTVNAKPPHAHHTTQIRASHSTPTPLAPQCPITLPHTTAANQSTIMRVCINTQGLATYISVDLYESTDSI
ncbi:unnamed protein product [Periconia digitata]|uniref:Uncharacterized protein n=1 Tax=Periconia digitata TaxID=1303443 RepID=A0A9W4XS52_9PLEO|nr:unnamed protein product [Periconia digitata]